MSQREHASPSCRQLLVEFVADIEAAYKIEAASPADVAEAMCDDTGWYDLAETYQKAVQLLRGADV